MAMTINALEPAPLFVSGSAAAAHRASPLALRLGLLLGCAVSVLLAAWLAAPASALRADPELVFLLRGMALIKAALVLAAVGVLCWRFGQPVLPRVAGAYLAGAWLTAGATMLVWQLSLIPLAALVFHVGEFMLLWVAWRDHAEARTELSVRRS
jgi:hypothetical protein